MRYVSIMIIILFSLSMSSVWAEDNRIDNPAVSDFIKARIEQLKEPDKTTELIYQAPLNPQPDGRQSRLVIIKAGYKNYIWLLDVNPDKSICSVAKEVIIHSFPYLDKPKYFDADGDGNMEIFIKMEAYGADRGISAFILLSFQDDSWKVFIAPILSPLIREQFGKVGTFLEDFMQAVEFDGECHYVQPMSRGGCEIFDGPANTKLFLIYTALSRGEPMTGPHHYAVFLFRFTNAGFHLDPNWNKGKVMESVKTYNYVTSDIPYMWMVAGYPNDGNRIYDIDKPFSMAAYVKTEKDKLVREKLPDSMLSAIYDFTLETFNNESYEDPTRLSSLFEFIYRFTIPNTDLHVYAYFLDKYPPTGGFYSIVIFVHDPKTDRITTAPVSVSTDSQGYCPGPWVRFKDISGDSDPEIIVYTGHHYGTDVNHINMYGLILDKDLNPTKIFELKTGKSSPYAFKGTTDEERYGYIVRTVEKQTPSRLLVTVSLSKDRLEKGDHILGYETLETDETGKYQSTEKIIIDKEYLRKF